MHHYTDVLGIIPRRILLLHVVGSQHVAMKSSDTKMDRALLKLAAIYSSETNIYQAAVTIIEEE
jgi:hypothetical protein